MTPLAVIFDVYGTLLSVCPAGPDAPHRWSELCQRTFGKAPSLHWAEYCAELASVVLREHELARSAGIPFPEVGWRSVVRSVMPECASLGEAGEASFLEAQAGIWHHVQLMEGAADVLRALGDARILMGIASNAQPYTLRELARELAGAGLSLDLLEPELCFWSFAHGFSKPDPHVFRLLGARLDLRGIRVERALMIGNRLDNDILPARAQGWQTWHWAPGKGLATDPGGDWRGFLATWKRGLQEV